MCRPQIPSSITSRDISSQGLSYFNKIDNQTVNITDQYNKYHNDNSNNSVITIANGITSVDSKKQYSDGKLPVRVPVLAYDIPLAKTLDEYSSSSGSSDDSGGSPSSTSRGISISPLLAFLP